MAKRKIHCSSHKYALITGATSGIGYELAKIFAQNKHDLVLVARTTDKLKNIVQDFEVNYGVRCHFISCDLSQPNSASEVFRKIQSLGLQIEYLVNNAGFGNFGFFKETDHKKEVESIQVNVLALTELCKLFYPAMLENKTGGILNVASTAAFQPGPLMAVYFATKAYVESFTNALANEAQGTGVTITLLCPGPTKTHFQEAANMLKSKLFSSFVLPVAQAEDVALAGYNGLMAKKSIVIPGVINKLGVYTSRFVPKQVAAAVTRKIQESK